MFAASLGKANAQDALTPCIHGAGNAWWLPGLPLVAALLLAVAFNVISLETRRTASLEIGACSKPSRAAAIHQMVALH